MIFELLAAVVAAAVITTFMEEISDFFQETLGELRRRIGVVIQKSKAFIQKVGNTVKAIIRHYYREDGTDYVETNTREIPREEVPEDILELAECGREVDITAKLELESCA